MRPRQTFLPAALSLIVLLSLCGATQADVRLPAIFGDHMVLQRDVPIVVWGWADPGENVTVALLRAVESKISSNHAETRAGSDGRWSVQLPAQAIGLPVTLDVRGKNIIEVRHVLIGDVWFASGQSNMYWPVKSSADAEKEIAAANYPQIRSFDVWKDAAAEPRDDAYGRWAVCSPQTAGNFSAAAYYFARHLSKELKVPIGIVHASWAASSAHPWMSREGLAADPQVKTFADGITKQTAASLEKFRAEFEPQWVQWRKAAAEAAAAGKEPPRRPEVSFRDEVRHVPSALYNGMVAPLVPMRIKGVIWYQGENDVRRGMFYQKIFEALIRDWRSKWNQPEMPFLFVQLAAYQDPQAPAGSAKWAELRAAQAAALRVPRTAMACTIDIGDAANIHPGNKQDVGLRLALAAMKIAYGKNDVIASGPVLKKMTVDGNRATLTFDELGGGLTVKGDTIKGFAVAGEDRQFLPAEARIDGDTVVVAGGQVKAVVAVRYGWADNPECNLFNKAGLPAVPFRTDSW